MIKKGCRGQLNIYLYFLVFLTLVQGCRDVNIIMQQKVGHPRCEAKYLNMYQNISFNQFRVGVNTLSHLYNPFLPGYAVPEVVNLTCSVTEFCWFYALLELQLRLLYESAPMAFLMEQAGGIATTGTQDILEIVPKDIHQRCPTIMGSPDDVRDFMRICKKHAK